MAAKAAELQREVRENAEDYQNYLKDLYGWEKEIKVKDDMLKKGSNSSIIKNEEFPIRNKKTPLVNQVFSNPSVSSDNLSNHQNKQKAVFEKNQGNQYFKEGKYEQAIAHYSEAMRLDPTDAILPANRAIALIKLNKFEEAEKDCNTSISLDPTFVKAYHRRGTSRANTGNSELAISDFEKVLSIEPHNKAARQELERLLKSKEVNPKSKNVQQQKPNKIETISNQSKIKEVKPEKGSLTAYPSKAQQINLSLNHPLLSTVEQLTPVSNPTKSEPRTNVSIIQVKDNKQEGLAIEKLLSKSLKEKDPEENKKASQPQCPVVDDIPALPKNYIQFDNDWAKMKNNTSMCYRYLKQINPVKFPEIFRESLETDILAGILYTLKNEFVERNDPVLPFLGGLARVKRIGAVTMFLSRDQKNDLEFLLNHIGSKNEGTEEERKFVLQKLS